MKSVGQSAILLCGDDAPAVEQVRQILADGGHRIETVRPDPPNGEDYSSYHLAVVEASGCQEACLAWSRRLRARWTEPMLPVLYIAADPHPGARLAGFEAGADTCLPRPYLRAELLAQVQALLRIRDVHEKLTEKTSEVHRVNRRLQQAYQQIDQELELARRLQISFLPQTLPELPRVRFAVHYAPRGQVGGDFYDVFRLDENHIGFYVADAMGHGIPASLLTIFIKKGVRAKEVFGHHYRLVPPNEVLQRLNKDLLDQGLSETPFITMVYGLLDARDGSLQFSRAGHPYPLYIPREGEPMLWQTDGLLLGVFDAHFNVRAERLAPGDKLLLFSDGVDGSTLDGGLPACAARHRDLPIGEFVAQVAADLCRQGPPPDDLTLLGVEMQ